MRSDITLACFNFLLEMVVIVVNTNTRKKFSQTFPIILSLEKFCIPNEKFVFIPLFVHLCKKEKKSIMSIYIDNNVQNSKTKINSNTKQKYGQK